LVLHGPPLQKDPPLDLIRFEPRCSKFQLNPPGSNIHLKKKETLEKHKGRKEKLDKIMVEKK